MRCVRCWIVNEAFLRSSAYRKGFRNDFGAFFAVLVHTPHRSACPTGERMVYRRCSKWLFQAHLGLQFTFASANHRGQLQSAFRTTRTLQGVNACALEVADVPRGVNVFSVGCFRGAHWKPAQQRTFLG